MPAWADNFLCNEVRALVWLRSDVTGIKWELDHIIPISGIDVCGLHVENNLQVIPAYLNARKNNHLTGRVLWKEFFA